MWLSERTDSWIIKYFNVISTGLAAGVLVFGFSMVPKSIPILLTTLTAVLFVMFFSQYFMMHALWKSVILFVAIMHLGDLFIAHTGNRLLYEKLMVNWINNQAISKNKIIFVKKPKPLLEFYLDSVKEPVFSKGKEFIRNSDYYMIEKNEKLYEQFLEDKRFYLIKGIDKVKKREIEHEIALFGKMDVKKDKLFNYRLLFLSGDENGDFIPQDIISSSDFKTYYAMIPEVNPLECLSLFSIGNRIKWEKSYLPIINQGVELICKFDTQSSFYRSAWFNDASYWGVTPKILQKRSFFNGRYFLWTIDRADIDEGIDRLEDDLRLSSSKIKLVFFQKSYPNTKEIPAKYVNRLKNHGAIIINELIEKGATAADIKISYDELTIQTVGSKGNMISVLNNADSGEAIIRK
jgi:hypothetical protein